MDEIAWGEYVGKSGRKQSIMGHEMHSYASRGREQDPGKACRGKAKVRGEKPCCPSPEDLPNPGIELGSPTLQADSLPFELPGKPQYIISLLL